MNRSEKEKLVSSIQEKFKANQAGIIADFTGIDVPNMGKLRRDCREAQVDLFVAKNTILKRAAKDTDFDSLGQYFEGPTSVALGKEDPVLLAKTLMEFAKGKSLKVKAGVVNGKIMTADDVKQMALLPGREVLLSMVVSAFQSPYRGFVCALNGIITKFVRALSEIQKKKESENK